jgi:hypothetical protein
MHFPTPPVSQITKNCVPSQAAIVYCRGMPWGLGRPEQLYWAAKPSRAKKSGIPNVHLLKPPPATAVFPAFECRIYAVRMRADDFRRIWR